MAQDDTVILDCIRSACRLTEAELRYQLRKRGHPLADSSHLHRTLNRLEREGRVWRTIQLALT